MTLLSIVQNACDEIGLSRPAQVIGSSDKTAIRCLRFAVRTGRELVRRNCPYLIKEHTFNTVVDQVGYSQPSDFDHFVPFTQWNRTTNRRMYPILPNEWQLFQSGLATVSINERFRIRGKDREILIEPTPASVETLSFEYVSENYCESAGGAERAVWTADTDVALVDEELFELSLIWRLLKRLGEPYAEEKAEYGRTLDTILAQTLPIKLHTDGRQPAHSNYPDANFPS